MNRRQKLAIYRCVAALYQCSVSDNMFAFYLDPRIGIDGG
jgi:hypothetical protein